MTFFGISYSLEDIIAACSECIIVNLFFVILLVWLVCIKKFILLYINNTILYRIFFTIIMVNFLFCIFIVNFSTLANNGSMTTPINSFYLFIIGVNLCIVTYAILKFSKLFGGLDKLLFKIKEVITSHPYVDQSLPGISLMISFFFNKRNEGNFLKLQNKKEKYFVVSSIFILIILKTFTVRTSYILFFYWIYQFGFFGSLYYSLIAFIIISALSFIAIDDKAVTFMKDFLGPYFFAWIGCYQSTYIIGDIPGEPLLFRSPENYIKGSFVFTAEQKIKGETENLEKAMKKEILQIEKALLELEKKYTK